MKARRNKKGRSLGISGAVLSGLLLFAIILATPYFLSLPNEPTPKQAERFVRLHFKKQAGSLYNGKLDEIDELKFKAVEVGRLLPDYYLSHDVPSYLTKVVFVDSDGLQQTRYYSLGSGDHVVAERSRYLWLFAL